MAEETQRKPRSSTLTISCFLVAPCRAAILSDARCPGIFRRAAGLFCEF